MSDVDLSGVRLILQLETQKSALELYRTSAIFGASRVITNHFGSKKVSLAEQLEFLLYYSSESETVRQKLAKEWMLYSINNAEPTPELAAIVMQIDLVSSYPAPAIT